MNLLDCYIRYCIATTLVTLSDTDDYHYIGDILMSVMIYTLISCCLRMR